jgi:hypothetical protein
MGLCVKGSAYECVGLFGSAGDAANKNIRMIATVLTCLYGCKLLGYVAVIVGYANNYSVLTNKSFP